MAARIGQRQVAQAISKTIRASSGGLPYVKAMGVRLESRNQAQVSMNLTDFEMTAVSTVFAIVSTDAALAGVEIAGSEIVGLIPRKALEGSEDWLPTVENFNPGLILENRLGI